MRAVSLRLDDATYAKLEALAKAQSVPVKVTTFIAHLIAREISKC